MRWLAAMDLIKSKIASRYTPGINMLMDFPWKTQNTSLDTRITVSSTCIVSGPQLLKTFFKFRPASNKCMQCNRSVHGSPKWWFEFEKAAKAELAVRPMTDVIFGMQFLFNVTQATECSRCPESVLHSWKFLQDLKGSLNALLATL
jgi:hypothetical protein